MKIRYFLAVIAFIISAQSYAQTGRQVSGIVKDSTGTIPGATIRLYFGTDSLVTATDAGGVFRFNDVTVNQFSILVHPIGYLPIKRRFQLNPDNKPAVLAPFIVKSDAHALAGVTISDVNAIKLKEDTVEYNAAAYPVRQDAPVEDVLKKLPGIDVDKDGNVTAQGKAISKVRLNGKDYMAGDVTSLTRNLPADLVQSIQVVDDYGDQANITGIKTGDPQKVLNINIKPSKNYGYFGQGTVGAGRDDIPTKGNISDADRYVASENVFSFDGNRQIAVSGNLNNTNTNLFNFGGGPGGGRGGGPPGFNSNSANGITTARSIGLNYRDSWGKKITAYGSYSFTDNTVNTTSTTIINNISLDRPSMNNTASTQTDNKINHRFNFNIEYKPDTVNYFKFTPTFSYASVHTLQNATNLFTATADTTKYQLTALSHSSSPSFGAGLLYNHRFNSHGRNFSVLVTGGSSKSDQYQNPVYDYLAGKATAPVYQVINTNSRTDSVGASFSNIEPLSKLSYLECNYAYHNSTTTADKATDTLVNR